MITSQIKFVKTFRENFEFYSEIEANLQGSQHRKFGEICLNMQQQHERILADLTSNVNNISEICTMFLQYVKVLTVLI